MKNIKCVGSLYIYFKIIQLALSIQLHYHIFVATKMHCIKMSV